MVCVIFTLINQNEFTSSHIIIHSFIRFKGKERIEYEAQYNLLTAFEDVENT